VVADRQRDRRAPRSARATTVPGLVHVPVPSSIGNNPPALAEAGPAASCRNVTQPDDCARTTTSVIVSLKSERGVGAVGGSSPQPTAMAETSRSATNDGFMGLCARGSVVPV
jgi:hypothetical protein